MLCHQTLNYAGNRIHALPSDPTLRRQQDTCLAIRPYTTQATWWMPCHQTLHYAGNRMDALPSDPTDRKSTRLNSSHSAKSRMPSSAWKKKFISNRFNFLKDNKIWYIIVVHENYKGYEINSYDKNVLNFLDHFKTLWSTCYILTIREFYYNISI